MSFVSDLRTNSCCGAAASSSTDDIAITANTLMQLHNFFDCHSFDTSGPYSDLFSVLLSCCKQLVDVNIQHNAVLLNQKKDMCGMSSEMGVLRDMASRCQDELCEFKSLSPLQDEKSRLPFFETARCVAVKKKDVDIIAERLETTDKYLQETKAEVLALRCRQKELERQQLENCSQQKMLSERMQQLAENVDKVGCSVTSHAEYINEEVATLMSAVRASTPSALAERESALKEQIDNKIETLKSELCAAVWKASTVTDAGNADLPMNQPSAAGAGRKTDGCGDLAAGLRRLGLLAAESVGGHVEQLKSRVEVLEVYAPHQRAVAARPPFVGLELSDEDGVGVRVDKVFRGCAGESAGVMPGDILLAVNGYEVSTRAEVYAVMTEIMRDYQSKCRFITQTYFKQHAGRCSSNHITKVGKNNSSSSSSTRTAARGGAGKVNYGVNMRDYLHVHKMSKAVEDDCSFGGCWELPQLKFSLYLKRDGRLFEVSFTVESANELV